MVDGCGIESSSFRAVWTPVDVCGHGLEIYGSEGWGFESIRECHSHSGRWGLLLRLIEVARRSPESAGGARGRETTRGSENQLGVRDIVNPQWRGEIPSQSGAAVGPQRIAPIPSGPPSQGGDRIEARTHVLHGSRTCIGRVLLRNAENRQTSMSDIIPCQGTFAVVSAGHGNPRM